jgi:hypothetical protein
MRNKLVRTARVVGLLIIVASLFGLPRGRFLAPVQAQNHGRSVSKEIVGRPVAAGKFMFWLQRDGRSSHLSIYGYDADQDALFSLPGKPMLGSPLATDGATVAWVERYQGRDQRVQGFDLSTGQELTLLPSVGPRELGGIAIQNQVLFYQDVSLGHRGIYARDVTTGQEQQITPTGREPVAADNRLLWTEEVYRGQYLPPRTSLHLRHLDGRAPDAVLAVGDAPLSGYSISGDYVVWVFAPPAADRRAYLHTLRESENANRPRCGRIGGRPYPGEY